MQFAKPRGWQYAELRALFAALRAKYPETIGEDGKPIRGSRPFLVVLDFLQLVGGEERELRERIANAAYEREHAV